MAEPLSVASGVAGIITLSSAVVAAGYKYLNSVRSAPEDLKDLIREIASLNTLISQLVTLSLSAGPSPRDALVALADQNVLQDCQQTLLTVQKHVNSCELISSRRKNAIKILSWPMKQKDIVKGRESISRLCSILTAAVTIDNASSLVEMELIQQRSLVHTETLVSISHNMEEQKILAWLSTFNPEAKHIATTALQQPGTSDWLLQKQAVITWIDSGDFLWLYGASGTGKTVLVSNIIDHLRELSSFPALSRVVAYHYCEFANPFTLEPRQIVGSLVRQLTEQLHDLPQAVRDAYHKLSRESPSLKTLTCLLHQIAESSYRTVYLVIDGVDECLDREAVLQMLHDIQNSPRKPSHLTIMVSSRPESDLRRAWSSQPSLSILPEDVKQSLEFYVRKEVASMPKLSQLPASERADLTATLVSRADGMFRWAQCQIDSLRKIRTRRALQNVLLTLPGGLFETYDRILQRVDDRDCEFVIRVLKWLVGSDHPLTLEELAEAIAIDPTRIQLDPADRFMDTEEVLDLCGSLLTIRPDGRVVLAHFSVREYLLSDRLAEQTRDIVKFALDKADASQHISRCLLTYVFTIGLRVQELNDDILDEGEFPLLQYAKTVPIEEEDFDSVGPWVETHFPLDDLEYCRLVPLVEYAKPPALREENYSHAQFVRDTLQCALMCYWNGCAEREGTELGMLPTKTIGNKVASMFQGLQHDWDDPRNLQCIITHCGSRVALSPICTAAVHGFVQSLRSLLANGALVDGIYAPHYVGNPLLEALAFGHEKIVHILDEYGADFNICSRQRMAGTALLSIVCYSPERRIIRKLLQQKRLNLNMVDCIGRTVHYWVKYDPCVSYGLQRYKLYLEEARTDDIHFLDRKVLYTTIVDILRGMKRCSTIRNHCGRAVLSKALSQCGPEYLQYASIIDEQALASRDHLVSPYWCDSCPIATHMEMRGSRFTCLICQDSDLCADCYAIWKNTDDEMKICKGHTFREVPRPCWYTLKPGTVTEDGKTLTEFIDFLYNHFTGLLKGLAAAEQTPTLS